MSAPTPPSSPSPQPAPGAVVGARLPLDPVSSTRPQNRAETEGRGRTLDSLAIGGPLSAAFIGLLLVEGVDFAGAQDPGGHGGAGAAEAAGLRFLGEGASLGGSAAAAQGAGSGEDILSMSRAAQDDAFGDILDPATPTGLAEERAGWAAAEAEALAEKMGAGGLENNTDVAPGEMPAGAALSLNFARIELGWPDEPGSIVGAEERPGPIGVYLEGGDDGETLIGTENNDIIIGGAGDDVIHGVGGNNQLYGGAGDDIIHGGTGDDLIYGGSGDDVIHAGGGDNLVFGGEGDDTIHGGSGNDVLHGGPGDDHIDAGGGSHNELHGGWGDDTLVVHGQHDVAIETGRGPDGGGDDTLVVGPGLAEEVGPSTFVFSDSFGALPGDVHADTRQVGPNIENLTLEGDADHHAVGDAGDNVIYGNAGNNVIHGMDGDDILHGVGGDNILYGGSGNDILHGGTGNDILHGGGGDDILHGGGGDNVLNGGGGNNQLYGGSGHDTFVFTRGDDGFATIRMGEGTGTIELEGYEAPALNAALIGGDLWLVVDYAALATIENYVGNEHAFTGIKVGDQTHAFEDLLT